MSAKRDYQHATEYESSPEQIHKRSLRNQARAAVEKRLGHKLPPNVDVDHKTPMKNGGSNADANLRAISEHRNTAWRKGSTGYKVKPV